MPKKKDWVIIERHMGREGNWGQCCHDCQKIEIDPRQDNRQFLKTLIHELIHAAFPEANEADVVRATLMVYRGVWKKGYRRIFD